jgi:hypothetical protein
MKMASKEGSESENESPQCAEDLGAQSEEEECLDAEAMEIKKTKETSAKRRERKHIALGLGDPTEDLKISSTTTTEGDIVYSINFPRETVTEFFHTPLGLREMDKLKEREKTANKRRAVEEKKQERKRERERKKRKKGTKKNTSSAEAEANTGNGNDGNDIGGEDHQIVTVPDPDNWTWEQEMNTRTPIFSNLSLQGAMNKLVDSEGQLGLLALYTRVASISVEADSSEGTDGCFRLLEKLVRDFHKFGIQNKGSKKAVRSWWNPIELVIKDCPFLSVENCKLIASLYYFREREESIVLSLKRLSLKIHGRPVGDFPDPTDRYKLTSHFEYLELSGIGNDFSFQGIFYITRISPIFNLALSYAPDSKGSLASVRLDEILKPYFSGKSGTDVKQNKRLQRHFQRRLRTLRLENVIIEVNRLTEMQMATSGWLLRKIQKFEFVNVVIDDRRPPHEQQPFLRFDGRKSLEVTPRPTGYETVFKFPEEGMASEDEGKCSENDLSNRRRQPTPVEEVDDSDDDFPAPPLKQRRRVVEDDPEGDLPGPHEGPVDADITAEVSEDEIPLRQLLNKGSIMEAEQDSDDDFPIPSAKRRRQVVEDDSEDDISETHNQPELVDMTAEGSEDGISINKVPNRRHHLGSFQEEEEVSDQELPVPPGKSCRLIERGPEIDPPGTQNRPIDLTAEVSEDDNLSDSLRLRQLFNTRRQHNSAEVYESSEDDFPVPPTKRTRHLIEDDYEEEDLPSTSDEPTTTTTCTTAAASVELDGGQTSHISKRKKVVISDSESEA